MLNHTHPQPNMTAQQTQSVAEILAGLDPAQRAILEASLKRGATGRAFVHVGNSQYYDTTTVEGQDRRTPSGIENPNSLKLSYTRKIGRRNAGMTVSRSQDGTLAIANATFSPVESLSISRDGKLSVTLKDTFTDAEKQFIATWMKAKFVARPQASVTTTTTTSDETTTEETPSEAPAAPATGTAPSTSVIKVAIIKSKKLKATDENVSLVQDLMNQGGMTLDAAIGELASAS